MSDQESSKQAAITADSGVNQDGFGVPAEKPLVQDTDITIADLGGDANEGVSSRFTEPGAPKYKWITPDMIQHPSYYRVGPGGVESAPVSRHAAQEAEKLARAYPDLDSEYMSNAAARTIGDRDILTKEELQKANDPGMLESIGLAFEPFDAPRRLLWGVAAEAGRMLPDPGSMLGDAVQSVVGVVGGIALGATIAGTEGIWSPISAIGSLFYDEDEDEGPIYETLPGTEMVDGFVDMAENLYGAIATGEIADKAKEYQRPWFWGEWSTARVVSGTSLIDAMITREQAWELSQREGTAPHLKQFARHLSTDVGRLMYGVVSEIAVDPLWLLGPGKGFSAAHTFAKGGRSWYLMGGLEKVGGSMQMLSREGGNIKGFNKAVGDLFDPKSTPKELENALDLTTRFSELATANVLNLRNNLDELATGLKGNANVRDLTRRQADLMYDQSAAHAAKYATGNVRDRTKLGDTYAMLMKKAETNRKKIYNLAENPESATRFLTKHTKTLASEIKTFEHHAENMSFALRTSGEVRAGGDASKFIGERGFLSLHIPFTTKHGYIFKEGPIDKATALIQSSPGLKKVADNYSLPNLEARLQAARLGIKEGQDLPFTEVFKGDRSAQLAYAAQKAVGHTMAMPMVVWDVLVSMFGTRYIQPLMTHMSVEAAELAGKTNVGTRIAGKYYMRLKKVQPEVWDEYQEAITTLMQSYGGLQMRLQSEIDRLNKAVKIARKARKNQMPAKIREIEARINKETDPGVLAQLRTELEEVKRWGDARAYTLSDVLLEAGSSLEAGAGKFAHLSDEAKAVAADLRKLVDEIKADPAVKAGQLQVEQALVNLARHAKGDPERRLKLMTMLQVANAKLEKSSNLSSFFKGKVHKALLERLTQLKSLREGLEGVDRDVLVKVLEEVKSLTSKNGYDSSVHSEYIYDFLVEATRSKVAAGQILRRFALGLGEADGGAALAKLVQRLTGTFEYAKNSRKMSPDKALERAINSYLKKLKEQYLTLRNSYKAASASKISIPNEPDRIGSRDFIPGMSRKDFRALVDGMIDDNDDTWRLMVPRDQQSEFKRWIDGESQLSPPRPDKPVKPVTKGRDTPSDSSAAERANALIASDAETVPVNTIFKNVDDYPVTEGAKFFPANTVIDNFSGPDFGSEYGPLMSYLKNSIGDDVVVHFVDDASLWANQLDGVFGISTGPVKGVDSDYLKRVIFIDIRAKSETRIAEALTHELFHAATSNRYSAALKGHLDGAVGPAEEVASDIRKLYNFFAEGVDYSKLDSELGGLLSKVTSPEELMAYGLTNPRVAEYLNGIEYASKAQLSLFNVLLEKIKTLFLGTNPNSANAELARLVDKLLDGPDSIVGVKSDLAMAKVTPPPNPSSVKDVTKGGFGFESSGKASWDRARSYYERAQHLRSLRRSAGEIPMKDMGPELMGRRAGVLKVGSEDADTERKRLSSLLEARGVRINKALQVEKGSPWHLKTARPVIKPDPVVVKPVVEPAAEKPAVVEPAPTPKPKAAPATDTVLPSHEPPKPKPKAETPTTTTKERHKHGRGTLEKSGIYRSRFSDDQFFVDRIDTDKGKLWRIRRRVAAGEFGEQVGGLYSTKKSAGEYLRNKLDVAEMAPSGGAKVTVKHKRVNYKVDGKRIKYSEWADPNTGNVWRFTSQGKNQTTVWTVTNKATGKELVFRPSKKLKRVQIKHAEEGLQEFLNVTRGPLEETAEVQKVINKTVAKNEKAGDLFTEPVVQHVVSSQPGGGTLSAEDLAALGFTPLNTKTYKPQLNDVIGFLYDAEEVVFRISKIRKVPAGITYDMHNMAGDLVTSYLNKIPFDDDLTYYLTRDGAVVTKKKTATAIDKTGKPEVGEALQRGAERFIKPAEAGKAKDVTVELPLNPQAAADSGWAYNADSRNRWIPSIADLEIALFEGNKLIGGGKVVGKDKLNYILESGETVAILDLKNIAKGKESGIALVVRRPESKFKKSQAQRDLESLLEDTVSEQPRYANVKEDAALFPDVHDARIADPDMPFTRSEPITPDQLASIEKSNRAHDELQLFFAKTKKPLINEFGRLYKLHARQALKAANDKIPPATRPDSIAKEVRDIINEIETKIAKNQPLGEDIISMLKDFTHDTRRVLGNDLDDTLYRAFLSSKSWKKSMMHGDLGRVANKLEAVLDEMDFLQPFHETLYRLEIGILRSDAKAIDVALESLEAGVLSGKRAQFPDVGTFAMSKDKVVNQVTAEAMRIFRVRRALKDATPDQIATSLLKIMSKGDDIDPIAHKIVMKSLQKEGAVLKKAFEDPSMTMNKLDQELETMKSSIAKFLKTPDDDELKLIRPAIDNFDDVVLDQTTAGRLFGATMAKEGAAIKRSDIITESFKKRKAEIQKELSETVKPHLEFRPDVTGNAPTRSLEAWETRLWAGAKKLFREHNLTREQELMVSFTVLREVPKFVNGDTHAALAKLYPSLMGQRFTKIDPTLEPVMRELESIIQRYEAEFAKRGYEWMADPERIMEDWGVLEFVPHLYKETDTRVLRAVQQGKVMHGNASGTDAVLYIGKDVREQRKMSGTILELKALKYAGTDKVLTLDPLEIFSRYSQVNRSMTNEDFLMTLIQTKVIRALKAEPEDFVAGTRGRTVEEIAEAEDMVPLFSRPNNQRTMDLLNRGSREDWLAAGLGPDDVGKLLDDAKLASTEMFATYLNSSAKIRTIRKVEQAILRIRAEQLRSTNSVLFEPRKLYNERIGKARMDAENAWDLRRGEELRSSNTLSDDIDLARETELSAMIDGVKSKIWDDIADEANTLLKDLKITAPKMDSSLMRHYFDADTQMWELYVPRGVVKNMESVLEMGDEMSGVLGAVGSFGHSWNAFWKTRVTVTSVAFSFRNAISNIASNMLDLGPAGALNYHTNKTATQISHALLLKEQFGSIANFAEKIAAGGKKQALWRQTWKTSGLKKLYEDGVDFKNGIVMQLDDVLDNMVDQGVSPAYMQFIDLARAESTVLQDLAEGTGITAKLTKKYQGVDLEDAVVMYISTLMTGGIPVTLPKVWGGKYLSRVVENQARVANFMGNFKKTGVWSDAADHANKFLFDYGDLTKFQRNVMRLVFPFFTWNVKNVHLQFEMMQKSPHFYANFHRLMSDGVPQVFEATQAQAEGKGYIKSQPLDLENLRMRETHYAHTVGIPFPSLEGTPFGNIPVPAWKRDQGFTVGKLGENYFPLLKNAKIQGLGLPQEGLMNTLGLVGGFIDPRNWGAGLFLPESMGGRTARARSFSDRKRQARIMGEVHFMLRAMIEGTMGHQTFYDKPIAELTDGRLINEILRPLDALPMIGPPVKAYLTDKSGLRTYSYYDKFNGRWRSKVHVYGQANHTLGTLPWMRNFRDAAAATELFFASQTLSMDELTARGLSIDDLREVPFAAALMDALSGLNVKQVDPDSMKHYADMRLKEMRINQLKTLGIIREFKETYVPYK